MSNRTVEVERRVIQNANGDGVWWNSRSDDAAEPEEDGRGKVQSGTWNWVLLASEM